MPDTEVRRSWLTRRPEQVAAHPEVEYVLLDRNWSVREVVLKSGRHVKSRRMGDRIKT